jgi:hypothetical protein
VSEVRELCQNGSFYFFPNIGRNAHTPFVETVKSKQLVTRSMFNSGLETVVFNDHVSEIVSTSILFELLCQPDFLVQCLSGQL